MSVRGQTTGESRAGTQGAGASPCPLCGGREQREEERIRLADLDHEYQRQLGVGVVSEFPAGTTEVELLRCLGCGLEFYQPGVAGSAAFYAALGRNQHYYSTTRWEFTETLRRLPSVPDQLDLLDVGCGDGFFLSLVPGTRKRGLELNPDAVRRARARGLQVQEGLLSAAAEGSADVVTLFQVLEHVPQPVGVLEDAVRVLRPGGRLFVAVPNNDGYMGYALHDPLNAPPHHPLRWRGEALRHVERVAPLVLEELLEEPLAPEHLFNYRRARFVHGVSRLLGGRPLRYRVSLFTTLLRRLANVWTMASLRLVPGRPTHPGSGASSLAVYRKRAG
ncbi:MAG: class I SAM-dependent methyltransferase [Verrucomicrobiales bacterium]|nr:class I SAM-dependent methyltransferase [Verrucomicrobiales bacterium]